jgi:putative inorganic carbon (HCO3(-)) transporter
VTIPAALFLVAGLISVLVAPDHRMALGLYKAYIVEPIAFGLVLVNVLADARRALIIVAGLAAGGLLAGLANAAVIAVALRHPAFNVLATPPVVIYNTANAIALFLVPLIAFAAAIALHWPRRRERLLAAGFAATATICALISFSRGGYLALAAVAIALVASHRRRWQLLAGAALIVIALLQVPSLSRRVVAELNLNDPQNTLVGRFHLWAATLQMLSHHLLFGAGLAGFATAIAPYWNATHADRFAYPHNIVLNFWTETGLLGLVAFALIMAAGFVRTRHGWRSATPEWRVVHLGVMLALVAILVHGLVDVPYWKNDLSLEFWVLLSLVFAPSALPRQSHRDPVIGMQASS